MQVIAIRVLRAMFADGLVRALDFAGALSGVLSLIDDDDAFSSVTVDPVARTISWASTTATCPLTAPACPGRSVGRGGTKPGNSPHTTRADNRLSWG